MMKSLLTFEETMGATHGTHISFAGNRSRFNFTSVATDSRNVVEGTLFVPLIGEFQDGHEYIPQALVKGASVVFITNSVYEKNLRKYTDLASEYQNTVFIIVENNLLALQDIARAYVAKFPKLIRIGVTGSSGKTTTKEICASILRQKYNVVTNDGNFNSETGLPLSVFKIREEHEIGIFEMGMNRENEMGEIARVLQPEYAIITNIGTAHIGILGSREKIAEEKKKIFNYIPENGAAIIPADDDFAGFLEEGIRGKIVNYGKAVSERDSGVTFISDDGIEGITFDVDGVHAHLDIPGIYNYVNALAGIALARLLKINAKQIADGIKAVRLPGGRSEIKRIITKPDSNGDKKKIMLLYDCYNANPDSMGKALDLCASLEIKGRKVYVLGDMKELGTESEPKHSEVGAVAAMSGAELVIFVGKEMEAGAKAAKLSGFRKQKNYVSSTDKSMANICTYLLDWLKDDDFVLLKASHSMGFERIAAGITDSICEGGKSK